MNDRAVETITHRWPLWNAQAYLEPTGCTDVATLPIRNWPTVALILMTRQRLCFY